MGLKDKIKNWFSFKNDQRNLKRKREGENHVAEVKTSKVKYVIQSSDDESLKNSNLKSKSIKKHSDIFSDKKSVWYDEVLASRNKVVDVKHETPKFNNKFDKSEISFVSSKKESRSNSVRDSEDESFKNRS